MKKNNIEYYEKTLGQLFCKNSSQQIIDMLVKNCQDNSVKINMQTNIISVEKTNNGFIVNTDKGQYSCKSLVISCGGLSIPKIGATGLGYKIAKQFDIPVIPTSPALVPLTFNPEFLSTYKQLSGVSLNATVSTRNISFKEGILFTHRGLSGPSILQISSYLKSGTHININLCPTINIEEFLLSEKQKGNNKKISSIIKNHIPQKLTEVIIKNLGFNSKLTETSNKDINLVATHINNWKVTPTDSEGYRTAEVTLGGVDTNYLSSKTMETKTIKGLYFIGEVVDVTGWLGGYNFQWAWFKFETTW